MCHSLPTCKTDNSQIWAAFSKLPTPTARNAAEVSLLRAEVVRLKKELASVSAQDEFSKWAKLRRQHDKAMAEHDKKGKCFDVVVSMARAYSIQPRVSRRPKQPLTKS